jgi:hypothetical protein
MKRILLGLLLVASTALSAFAQSGATVRQSGNVTPNQVPWWITSGVIGGGVTAADSPVSSFGVTNNGGNGICVASDRINAAGRQLLCLGATTNGPATISLQNYGTATPQSLNININGTVVPFPGSALPSITVNATIVNSGVSGYFLYNNAGIVGNFNLFGTANTWTAQQTSTGPISAASYKIGADIILTHPLTPAFDNVAGSLITLGLGAGASLAPIHSTQYLTLLGFNSGNSLTVEDHITCVGAWSCASYDSAGTNISITAIGIDSQRGITSGTQNISVGEHTLTSATSASFATVMGYNASLNIGGTYNSFFGWSAGQGLSPFTGQMNAGFGNSSLLSLTSTASFNVAVGPFSCAAVTTGSQNICGGYEAGNIITTGTANIDIGVLANPPSAASNNTLNIGNVIFGTAINTLGAGFIGIATQAPVAQFEVYGAGQTTAALTDAGARTGTIAINSSGSNAGNGGAIVFGNAQSEAVNSIGWAAIKAILSGGTGNTVGDLAFSTRNAISDTALTERMRIVSTGNINVLNSLTVQSATSIPAGGTAGAGILVSSTANFGVFFGSSTPTLAAAKGSLYLRSDGSSTSTRAYINTDGGTTWTAITTAG